MEQTLRLSISVASSVMWALVLRRAKVNLHPFRKRNTITKEDNNDEGKNHFVVKCHKHLMLDFVDICRYHQIKKIEYCEWRGGILI